MSLLNWPVWAHIVFILITTHITIISVTLFLHRGQAHRGVDFHPILSHFFRFWLWVTTGMVVKEWVAVHRKHHAKCETPEDPHSPQVEGIKKVLFRGAELYGRAVADNETVTKFGHGTPDDWLERNVYTPHRFVGISILLVVYVALFGPIGLTLWAIQMAWIPFWAAGVINGIGHYWGYRNYETTDTSTNLIPFTFIVGGEELHNNHHAYPSSAKFALRPWEFDIGWMYLQILSFLRLVKVKKVAPQPVIISRTEKSVDLDTARAIVINRLDILSDYYKTVIVPTIKQEVTKTDESYKQTLLKVKKFLGQYSIRVDEKTQAKIDELLQKYNELALVVQFKEQLQEIWSRTHTSQEKVLQALQEWCQKAEETKVKTLEDFANHLRSYRLVAAQ